jgi:hypothetical protein
MHSPWNKHLSTDIVVAATAVAAAEPWSDT